MNAPNANTLADRIGAITRGIASGNNACGSLIGRDGQVNTAFVAAAVRPTLAVYESEADHLRRENAEIRRDAETKRQALESVVANIPAIAENPGVMTALRAALPAHPFLA